MSTDLKHMLAQSLETLLASDHVQKRLDEALRSCVDAAIKDLISPYGEFNRGVRESVRNALNAGAGDLALPSYNALVIETVRARVDAVLNETVARQITSEVDAILQPVPREISVTQLAAVLREESIRHDRDSYSVHVQLRYPGSVSLEGYRQIILSDSNRTEWEVLISDTGSITSLVIEGRDSDRIKHHDPYHDLSRLLFALKVADSTITVPSDWRDIDVTLGEDSNDE